jgi:phage virion morphogenesis protein
MTDDILSIKIEIQSDSVIKAIDRLKESLSRKKDLMDRLGEVVAKGSRDRILSKLNKAPDGKPWQSLAASTLQRKRAKGKGGMGILMHEPDLATSIHAHNPTDKSVTIGTSLIYALIHQFGGETGRGYKVNMPVRPYIGVSNTDKERLKMYVQDWIKAKIKGE